MEPLSTFAAKQHSRIGILTLGIGTYVLCTLKWFHHLSSMEGVFLWVAPRFLRLHVLEEAIISLLPRRLSHRMTSSAVSRFWVHFKRVFWVCIHHLSSVWPPHALPSVFEACSVCGLPHQWGEAPDTMCSSPTLFYFSSFFFFVCVFLSFALKTLYLSSQCVHWTASEGSVWMFKHGATWLFIQWELILSFPFPVTNYYRFSFYNILFISTLDFAFTSI